MCVGSVRLPTLYIFECFMFNKEFFSFLPKLRRSSTELVSTSPKDYNILDLAHTPKITKSLKFNNVGTKIVNNAMQRFKMK